MKAEEKARDRAKRWYAANSERALAYQRGYYKKNRGKVIARTNKWVASNRQHVRSYMVNKHLEKRYGITKECRDLILSEQGGVCKICGLTPKTPCVDHDHKTGKIRGVLCNNCNRGIGHLKESIKNLQSAAMYLARTT